MAKEVAEKVENETAPAAETKAAAPAAAPQQQFQIEVDDSHVVASYANFCRVTGSPEELIIDFGLNPQPMGVPKNPIAVRYAPSDDRKWSCANSGCRSRSFS